MRTSTSKIIDQIITNPVVLTRVGITIINIDVTVFISGHHGDCSETYLVTEHQEEERHSGARRLLEVARRALYVGIDQCGPGRLFSGIGEYRGGYI